jgi:thiamine kinase-like enzyme
MESKKIDKSKLVDSTFYQDGQGKKEFLRNAFSPDGHNIIKNLIKFKSIAKKRNGK